MKIGTVKWFNAEMGYGFIEPDDGESEVFVHIRAVELSGMDDLKEGQRLNFDVFTSPSTGTSSAVGLSERLISLTRVGIAPGATRGSVRSRLLFGRNDRLAALAQRLLVGRHRALRLLSLWFLGFPVTFLLPFRHRFLPLAVHLVAGSRRRHGGRSAPLESRTKPADRVRDHACETQ